MQLKSPLQGVSIKFVLYCILNFYSGKTQDELLTLWLQEAKVGMGGKKKGKVVDLWKVLGERKVRRIILLLKKTFLQSCNTCKMSPIAL